MYAIGIESVLIKFLSIFQGVGDAASQFRIHETLNHYITFQHSLTGHFIGVDSSGQIAPPVYLNPSKDECKFEIHLMVRYYC